ncbi:hypothetical protein ASF06_01795 [Agreia sp. Leaf244]|uniref:hypothetical protein n=1 Tax=Agreia sp. Leaf244 TaxID=1736305 RepID=UPI0006FEA461|nr:hypothetical protein [Agreia sp. Leaf244]KQO11413.1 hypothetical protein ASF06_01795 [Agreia sp. Leaf244]
MATEDHAENDIPLKVLQIFKDEKARPKVIRTYDVNVGWLAEQRSPVLTWLVVDEFIESGKTSVDLKWRSKKHQVSLLDLRPRNGPVPRAVRGEPRVVPPQR